MSCPFTIKSCKYCPVETCGERETEKAYTTIAPNTLTEQAGVKMNKSIFEQKVEWIIKTPFYNHSVTDALVKAVSEELLELAKIEILQRSIEGYKAKEEGNATITPV